ncbi:Meiotic nuclear division protein 1 [Fasciola gigantica]|uniref:Meiotic nuclear division protein 1 homolog n=1 Tax=Fasciola gigantica TaxID=46835 RepID=A0A504XX07_FASGI|nr:Meiotic nuclear division protein 1 [Fasciola gigantica]
MMEFFYEKKDFFQLKEVERLCHKEKGINAMSVKDVLMSLVHDGMVDTEKIGTCVYFWAFPNKATQKHKGTIQKLKENVAITKAQHTKLKDALQEARSARQDTNERQKLLDELEFKRTSLEKLTTELYSLRRLDPNRLRLLEEERQVALDSANRWTDNVFVIQSWIAKKFPVNEAAFRKQFGIPESFDYLE